MLFLFLFCILKEMVYFISCDIPVGLRMFDTSLEADKDRNRQMTAVFSQVHEIF